MLETCDVCGGKGKTYEIPPKRCHDCNGKGLIEVEEVTEISGHGELGEDSVIDEIKTYTQPSPWYKRLFK